MHIVNLEQRKTEIEPRKALNLIILLTRLFIGNRRQRYISINRIVFIFCQTAR